MEEFQKQETIENIKARVEVMKKKAIPPTYTPGNQEVGSVVKIGETLYRVTNSQGTIRRQEEKKPSKIRKQRDAVAYLLSLENSNLKHRLEREDRINKIKMFNKSQRALERSVTKDKAMHPKLTPNAIKKVLESNTDDSEVNTEEIKPTVPNLQINPRYLHFLSIIKKKEIKKAKRRKANKLASKQRKLNVKINRK